jgi:lysophospholipase L1-like esterase
VALRLFADRAIVLLLGVLVGTCIGWSFASKRVDRRALAAPPLVRTALAAKPMSDVLAAQQCPEIWSNVRQAVGSNRPIRVGVFGDSYGDGVFAALQQQLQQLGADPLDVAVVSFGANDDQAIFTARRKWADLMSPAWQTEIGPRVDRYIALLRAHRAIVYWVGLPRMRDPDTDAKMQAVNAFYARRMEALGVPFLDSRPVVAGPDGGFAPYLPDPKTGKSTLMRLGDGVHMTFPGYVAITRAVAGRIRAYVAGARAANAAEQGTS